MASTPYTYTSPDDPAREDDGLFGPGSVTWRVMSSRIMWVAVVRALYLQALHPRVIRGTLQNAPALTEPVDAWARLRRTRKFIETRTFGTTAEAEHAGRRVRKIHQALTGTDPDGTRYRLDEPELLLWVHCGEVASCADIARRRRLPFSAADLDAFVAEQRASAELIGIDRAAAPASMAELDAYYEQIRPRLHAGDEARQALRVITLPPVPSGNRGRTSYDVTGEPLKVQLETFLDEHRAALRGCLDGMTEEEARRRLVPSETTLLGLVRHVTFAERVWFGEAVTGRPRQEMGLPPNAADAFTLTGADTIDTVRRAHG